MKIRFTKMTGAGNDFVVIDNRDRCVKNGAPAARILCDRRWGVGADGLLLLEKSRKADFRMMYFNADGSSGGMCGNGGRCIAQFAVMKKIAPRRHKFEALDHVYHAVVKASEVELGMKDPAALQLGRKILLDGKILAVNYVDTGSPHVVVLRRELSREGSVASLDVTGIGRKIRYHEAFKPAGANVNFIEEAGANSVRIRTYERGVEAETLACGTGSIASAIIASRVWKMSSPITVIPESKKDLRIEFDDDGQQMWNVRLIGPAEVVFEGSTNL